MIKISAVSYLNTIPFIYGITQSKLINNIDLQLDYPAICAEKFINEEVDLALVPVIIMPYLQQANIISDYCIGSNGTVETVCLYSDVPIEDVKSIVLDYQSKTSVQLLKILLKEYWNLSPKFIKGEIGFENSIKNSNAALVIGDRAFNLNKKHPYIYDLSAIWKDMTGLPFVFAVWVANKKLSDDFIKEFNKSLKTGLKNIDKALNQKHCNYLHCKNAKDYLNNKISYYLDDKKLEAMDFFLSKI